MAKKTPELLTATQRAAQLKLNGLGSPSKAIDTVAYKSNKNAQYEELAKKALLGTPPPLNAMGSMSPADVVDGSVSSLAIADIERYEHDPRTEPNPLYDEIKASIRANGILNNITVTKRPGSQRYTVYGGGNTRLRIAKELYEEGDQRFARLTVIVKVWKGDASTIAAHLAENEQRGDISFWEKAQGIQKFKSEFERETSRTLSAADLNRELKQAAGLNYGLRMLQNFLFAVEHLTPVGPWLRARDVNLLIRPSLAALLELSSKLEQSPAAEKAIQAVLHQHAALLNTQSPATYVDDDRQETSAQGLDTEVLLADVTKAVAEALDQKPEKLLAMTRAIEANPRIAVDTLMLVEPSSAGTSVTASHNPSLGKSLQMPLGRMLSGIQSERGQGAALPEPVLGKASPSKVAPHRAAMPPLPDSSGAPSKSGASGASASIESDLESLFTTLGDIQSLVNLSDVVFTSDQLSHIFGFYLDFPKEGIGRVNGVDVAEEMIVYRVALWKLLVSLTGQLDQRFTQAIPVDAAGEPIVWKQLFDQGEAAFHATAQQLLSEPFDAISLSSLGLLFSHTELGYLVSRMLTQMEQVRINHPERQLDGFVPLFMSREDP